MNLKDKWNDKRWLTLSTENAMWEKEEKDKKVCE